MPALSKAQILSVQDVQMVQVEVPEWGGSVWIKTMSGAEREQFEAFVAKRMNKDGKVDLGKVDLTNVRATLLAYTLVDDNGALIFTVEDVEALNKKSGSVLNQLAAKAQEVNGMSKDSAEEMRKNS